MTDKLRIKVTKILLKSELTRDEVADIHDILSLAIPVDIKAEQWIYTKCPNCGKELSTGGYDGYYKVDKIEYCTECRQVFNWIN